MCKKLVLLVMVVCMANVASAALVAHYTFDQGGSTFVDSSGNGWDAPIVGTHGGYIAGVSGTAYNFADFDYGHPANGIMTAGTKNAITIAFWAKGNANIDNGFNNAFQAAGPWGGHYNTTQITWTTGGVDGDGNPARFTQWITSDFSANQMSVALTPDYTSSGAWHHYAYTKSTATGLMQIYIDGELVATATGKTKTMSSVPDTYHVGIGGGVYGSSAMDGALDEFYLYDNVLTADQIMALASVPEPATLTLLGLGLAAMLRRKK
jgi:hypothetical protein